MTDTVYQWPGGLGRKAIVDGDVIRRTMNVPVSGAISLVPCILCRPLYSTKLEWVPESKLSVYHGDNQPEGK